MWQRAFPKLAILLTVFGMSMARAEDRAEQILKASHDYVATRSVEIQQTVEQTTRISVECPPAEAGGCKGTLTLLSAKPLRIGSAKVIAVLGSARYTLKPGERKTVTVALPKGVRKLAVKRAIAARAQTVTSDAAGNVAVGSRTVSLRLAR